MSAGRERMRQNKQTGPRRRTRTSFGPSPAKVEAHKVIRVTRQRGVPGQAAGGSPSAEDTPMRGRNEADRMDQGHLRPSLRRADRMAPNPSWPPGRCTRFRHEGPETRSPARKRQTRRSSTEPHISPYPGKSVMQLINVRRGPAASDRRQQRRAEENNPTGNSEKDSDRNRSSQRASVNCRPAAVKHSHNQRILSRTRKYR